HGLSRKFWTAFVLQLSAVCFAAVIGVYGASVVIKEVLIKQALQDEASHFWRLKQENEKTQVPDTFNMKAYLLELSNDSTLPEKYRMLSPGYHALEKKKGGELIWVETKQNQKLILIFKQEQVDALAFWFGVVPLILLLIVVYAMVWASYKTSKRLVSPVIWLANKVSDWDPKNPDVSALAPNKLPIDMDNEAEVLAGVLHDFGLRISQFVEREQNFTSNASHELRTPLTVIRMASEMVAAEQGLSTTAVRSIDRIQKASKEMESLIEGFLLLARENDIGHEEKPYWASELIADEADKAQLLIRNKPIEWQTTIRNDFQTRVPYYVLSIVIGNLVRNACHYTDQGKIEVIIDTGKIQVIDTGIGMNAEQLNKVYELFYRGENNNQSGKGIGMSLVKKFCDRFGWSIEMKSMPQKGTTATLLLNESVLNE
ncbi:MAG TPA: HAMP domain-containing sensor histidine kinase, partial [Arenimonas sp.]|nr:HAMP domain-containing sensor histidine kinase [Arenimonas sp.]